MNNSNIPALFLLLVSLVSVQSTAQSISPPHDIAIGPKPGGIVEMSIVKIQRLSNIKELRFLGLSTEDDSQNNNIASNGVFRGEIYCSIKKPLEIANFSKLASNSKLREEPFHAKAQYAAMKIRVIFQDETETAIEIYKKTEDNNGTLGSISDEHDYSSMIIFDKSFPFQIQSLIKGYKKNGLCVRSNFGVK